MDRREEVKQDFVRNKASGSVIFDDQSFNRVRSDPSLESGQIDAVPQATGFRESTRNNDKPEDTVIERGGDDILAIALAQGAQAARSSSLTGESIEFPQRIMHRRWSTPMSPEPILTEAVLNMEDDVQEGGRPGKEGDEEHASTEGADSGRTDKRADMPVVPLVPLTYMRTTHSFAFGDEGAAGIAQGQADSTSRLSGGKLASDAPGAPSSTGLRKKIHLADLVSGLRGVKESDIKNVLSKPGGASNLTLVSSIRKWQKKAKRTPRDTMLAVQQERVAHEIPRSLYLDLLAEVIPIVSAAHETYRAQLGERSSLTIAQREHLGRLNTQLQRKRVEPITARSMRSVFSDQSKDSNAVLSPNGE